MNSLQIDNLFSIHLWSIQPLPLIIRRSGGEPIKFFTSEKSKTQLKGITQKLNAEVEKAKTDIKAYFNTLSQLQDFLSMKPSSILNEYQKDDRFIKHCENDYHKLMEITNFLSEIQKKVWINIFVLNMSRFIEEHIGILRTWEKDFINSIKEYAEVKKQEIAESMIKIRKSLKSQDEVSNTITLERSMTNVAKKVNDLTTISKIMERTDPHGYSADEIVSHFDEELTKLKSEKEKAVIYFQEKKVEDIRQLELQIETFQTELQGQRVHYDSHGPFNLSWKSFEALQDLQDLQEKLNELAGVEMDIRDKAAILGVLYEASEELQFLGDDISNLQDIWGVVQQWETI